VKPFDPDPWCILAVQSPQAKSSEHTPELDDRGIFVDCLRDLP